MYGKDNCPAAAGRAVLLWTAWWCLCGAWAPASAADAPAKIRVDPRKVLAAVPRFVFGHNVEAADPKDIFGPVSRPIMGQTGDGLWDPVRRRPAPEVLAMAKELGVTMLRYPGGCLTHNFDWKKAVGPVKQRPNFTFGVDEYLHWCRAAGAEPLMNVSAYVGGPKEAAELVEYLNAPATADHPWAQKRARWGHPEPYGVRHFEMGNESDHGNHDVKPFRKHTPAGYAAWVNDCSRRMRAVDARVRIGAHMGTGTGPEDPWNADVLARTRGRVDFVIVHTYAVGLWDPKGANPMAKRGELLMRACMAAGEQTEAMLAKYRQVIREAAGRDLPLAITEYNAAFVQEQPIRYRFTFGAALFCADYLRVLLKPETNVRMANYWHLVNGYWGMLRGPRRPRETPGRWKKLPAWYLFRLWGRHFGTKLVDVQVDSPTLEFEGCLGVRPARKHAAEAADAGFRITSPGATTGSHRWKPAGPRSLIADLEAHRGERYLTLGSVPAQAGRTYRLSHDGRVTGGKLGEITVGLDLIDSRGWHATRSGCATHGAESAAEWRTFRTEMVTQPGCRGLDVHLRLIPRGAKDISGRFEIRNIRIERLADPPPYAVLTASASVSADGKTLYLVVFNKHHAEAVSARVVVADGSARGVRAWTVTGPSLLCTNLGKEQVRETVSGRAVAGAAAGGFACTFPARSMTALEIAR